jgi:Tol biopolymer transport system component
MNAVLTEQPRELEGASTNFPPALGRVVRRCLDKDPDNRFQSAKDLTFSIELSSDGTPHSRQLSVSHGPGVLKVFLAAIGLMALAFCAGILTTRLRSPARPFTAIRYLTYSGHDHSPSTCTDGRRICFSSDRDGTSRIWVKDVGSGWENPVTSGSDDFPRFSPDGSAILFTRTVGTRKDLFRVPSIGGEPSRVVANVLYADWSPDARQVAFIRWGEKDSSSVYTVHTDGSSEALLHRFDDSRCSLPRWSPDGRRLAVTLNQSGHAQSVAVIVIGTRETKVFFAPDNYNVLSGLSWAADSQGVFFLQSESVAADTSGSTAVLFHQPLASRQYRKLLWSPVMGTVLDLLPSGNFLFDARSSRQNLKEYSIGSSNMIPRWLTLGNSTDRQPAYSPAGDEIVFSSNRSGNMEIWSVSRKPGSIPRRLTENPADDWDAAFSPDGRYVIWSSKRSGNLEVWMANADGSAPRPVTHDGFAAQNPTMTKDGRWIVYASYSPKRAGIWKIHPDGTQDTKLVPSQTVVGNAEVSPDGRYAAYRDFADEPVPVIKVLEIESGTQVPFEISVKAVKETPARLGRVRWMPNGKALAFIGQNEAGVNGVFVQDFIAGKDTTDSRRPLGPFDPENSAESFGISPDGQFITISTWEQSFNVMVTEGLDDPVFRR